MVSVKKAKKDKENTKKVPKKASKKVKRILKLYEEGRFPSEGRTIKKIEKLVTFEQELHFVVSWCVLFIEIFKINFW